MTTDRFARVNYYAGGNRPPFKAWLECPHGERVDLIPVLTLALEGRPQHWHCYVPPAATPCVPFMFRVSIDPERRRELAVTLAVDYDPAENTIEVHPPTPVQATPN